MQLCIDSDIDIFASAMSAREILSNKSELIQASITETPPNAYINNKETTSWIISGLLIFYILALILSKKYIPLFGIMLFSRKNKNISYHNFSHSFAQTTNVLVAFSMFIVSVFFYLVEKTANTLQKTPLELFAVIAIAVCLYVVFKIATIKLVGYISENDELKSKLFAIEIIILSIYGLFSGFFLTLCFASTIKDINIWLTVISAIIILLYLFKLLKIIMLFINEKISLFFLILYLCAIEILPTWLIIDFL
jgi:hypothetical protein